MIDTSFAPFNGILLHDFSSTDRPSLLADFILFALLELCTCRFFFRGIHLLEEKVTVEPYFTYSVLSVQVFIVLAITVKNSIL